ncbi:hypothetical protein CsSME_00037279 [Camellia sinensis var. sinensis]
MRATKYHGDEKEKMVINGPRPTPLRIINKGSHVIHKQRNQQHPIITYTKSPKIIHAKPRDFMALVQRLTGLSSSSRSSENNETSQSQPRNNTNSYEMKSIKVDDDESSSSLKDENCGAHKYSSVLLSPNFNVMLPSQFLADIPLFTPNSANLFLSPPPLYVFDAKKELPQY